MTNNNHLSAIAGRNKRASIVDLFVVLSLIAGIALTAIGIGNSVAPAHAATVAVEVAPVAAICQSM